MGKKVVAQVKLAIEAGKANPAPPVGTALGPHGVNIMVFCKEYNARTSQQVGMVIPVVITIFADRSFTFETKTPPASILLKKAAGLDTKKKPGVGGQAAQQREGWLGNEKAGRGDRADQAQGLHRQRSEQLHA